MPSEATEGGQRFPELKVHSLQRAGGITEARMNKRLEIWKSLQSDFLASRASAAKTHNTVYEGTIQLMNSEDAEAFDLSKEPVKLREEYGSTVFGQGYLMAHRLIERGGAC